MESGREWTRAFHIDTIGQEIITRVSEEENLISRNEYSNQEITLSHMAETGESEWRNASCSCIEHITPSETHVLYTPQHSCAGMDPCMPAGGRQIDLLEAEKLECELEIDGLLFFFHEATALCQGIHFGEF